MDDKIKTLYEICETISRELEDANEKIRKAGGKLSAGDVDYIDKLTHTIKSLKTTIAMMEAEGDDDGYSSRGYMSRYPYYGGNVYRNEGNMGGNTSNARSYARGRGRNAKRDSMGRYSRDGGYSYAEDMEDTKEEIRELAMKMPEEHRMKIERALDSLN